jgi:hypothetical protein
MSRMIATFLVAVAISTTGAIAVTQNVRHLVYNFTYTNSTDLTQHTSGINGQDDHTGFGGSQPASGVKDYKTGGGDRGTIVVDVTRVQPDTGLVVEVSEQANDTRSAQPATCVVYGNTTVVCDANKVVNAEEMELLRLLGSNFVDPAQVDAKNHWRVDQSGPNGSDVADFSIGKNDAGKMDIASQRVVKTTGVGAYTITTDGTIVYDFSRTVPTSVVEDQIMRQNGTMGNYTTVHTMTSMTLAQDSAAPSGAP